MNQGNSEVRMLLALGLVASCGLWYIAITVPTFISIVAAVGVTAAFVRSL